MKDKADHGAPRDPVTDTSDLIRPSSRATRVRYKVMALLCVLAFLTYFDRVCIVRAQLVMQRDLHISDAQMGLILGAFWLAYALFEIPGGFLGDRYGARGTLTRIVLAWSLFTALSGSATGFLSLLAYRFLFGAGEAGAFPNMARIQAAWLPARSRARAGGFLWMMARWGGAFSPIIFGHMMRGFESPGFHNAVTGTPLEHVAPWRLGFWMSGLLGSVWVIAFWFWFRDNPADKRSVNAAELVLIREGRSSSELPGSHRPAPGVIRAVFSSGTLWLIAMVYVCGSFGWSFFVSWMPRFLKDVHGVTFEKSEWMNVLPMFFGGIACLLGGSLSDWLVKATGRKRLFRAVFPLCGDLTAACAMLGIRFVKSPEHATILLCVASAAHDFGQAVNWATIVDVGGRFAGTAFGFINMVGNFGNTAQPYVGQLIFNHLGWNALFLTYAAFFATASSMWLFIDPNRRFYPEPEHPPEPPDQGFEAPLTAGTAAAATATSR
ncbi:MAG TPA: MFS transporter [Tepidisphaeraceae bacterium]